MKIWGDNPNVVFTISIARLESRQKQHGASKRMSIKFSARRKTSRHHEALKKHTDIRQDKLWKYPKK